MKDSNSESQKVITLPIVSIKYLAKRKTAYAKVDRNLSEKMETPTSATTTQQLCSNFPILVIFTKSIYSHGSKCISIRVTSIA